MIANDLIVEDAALIHLVVITCIVSLMILWEMIAPRRELVMSRWQRWRSNLGLILVSTLLLRLIFPAAAVGAAVIASEHSWGLFNWLELPAWLAILISLLVLDLAIFGQHVAFHANAWLWQLHKVHHADLDIDFTTGLRFHPIEILLSMLFKYCIIFLFGAPVIAVLLFEIILNGTAVFNHGNVRLAPVLDRVIRWLIVTPDMHRVHHSINVYETDSNFGFNISIWDRLFGTYRDQPEDGHENMTIGIEQLRNPGQNAFLPMLLFPFTSKVHHRN